MSSVSVPDASQEDVRSTLFSELRERERGLLSSIKAQLRGKLIQELQSLAFKVRPTTREYSTQRCSRLCTSVVAEYLERAGLEYTLRAAYRGGEWEGGPYGTRRDRGYSGNCCEDRTARDRASLFRAVGAKEGLQPSVNAGENAIFPA